MSKVDSSLTVDPYTVNATRLVPLYQWLHISVEAVAISWDRAIILFKK